MAVYEWESLLVGLQYFSNVFCISKTTYLEMELILHRMLILFLLFERRAAA